MAFEVEQYSARRHVDRIADWRKRTFTLYSPYVWIGL